MNDLIVFDSKNEKIWRWKNICSRLAKSVLEAHRAYHKSVLGHFQPDGYKSQIRNKKWTCQECGETYSLTIKEMHQRLTGQSVEETDAVFKMLDEKESQWREKLNREMKTIRKEREAKEKSNQDVVTFYKEAIERESDKLKKLASGE